MKKILITARELDCGGTEVALINLIKNLEPTKFNITLLVVRKRGVYLDRIPNHVKIVEIPFKQEKHRYFVSDDESLINNKVSKFYIKSIRKIFRIIDNIKKINYKFDFYHKYLLKKTEELNEEFDLAIDFFGYGSFQTAYVAEKIIAKKKIMWIHDERLLAISGTRCYFEKFTYFFGVSNACVQAFQKQFPETNNKVGVFYNFIDREEIIKKSKENIEKQLFDKNKFNMISVGRLEWQKGFDLAIEVATKLKEKNIDFCWYILGDGKQKKQLQDKINYYNLNKEFILLGRKDNPYPYIKRGDLYIQTSRHEGYGLAIAEARVLSKAIVSTDLECVREQIQNGQTGYLVPFNADEFYNIILKLYYNRDLIKILEKNLKGDIECYKREISKLERFL